MKKIEITEIPPLTQGEQSLLDFHSIVNVLNVLRCELMVLGDVIGGDTDLLSKGLGLCERLLAGMSNHAAALQHAREADEIERVVMDEIHQRLGASKADAAKLAESLGNVASVFSILKVRACEILARSEEPTRWEEVNIAELEVGLRMMFAAIERNSHGRFRILSNPALQTERDYYADLRFETAGGIVRLPSVFTDVIRDLIANARKYTQPGGQIVAALYQDDQGTCFVVRDTGCGIPPDELETVVHFGKRASNVTSRRTFGGGFGLTKAFFVTKQFGGRFWIASELGRGTEVRIWLPPATPDPQVAAENKTVATSTSAR